MRRLTPFTPDPALEPLQLQAEACLEGTLLRLRYRVVGPLEVLAIPAPASGPPRRLDGLWQGTCLEAFLAGRGCSNYWELNLSPSGDWNLYRFDAYRCGGREETRISGLSASRWERPDRLELELQLNLERLLPPPEPLEISLTAVLEHRLRGCSYWALRHTGEAADFHRRDSFLPWE